MPASTITNALTIDVEDWFQVSAMAPYIRRCDWPTRESRVERNVDRLLQILDANGVQATFFVLGWVAERSPQLVKRIVASGHELASHGYGHERASDLDRAALHEDLVRAKGLLEDTAGVAVRGYRAPSFSIGHGNLWAFDTLLETGHAYSSSIYPIRHDHYGMPDAPRFAHRRSNGLLEVPVSTVRLGQRNLPSSGGGWFRLFPYAVSRWMIQRVNRQDQQAAIFYMHPWEIDPGQPRVPGIDAKTRFRHYVNIGRTERRLQQLLQDFRWGRMDRIFLDGLDARPDADGAECGRAVSVVAA